MDWANQVVLVTGGTSSLGMKFTEMMLRQGHPKRLLIFSRDESKQHEMQGLYPEGPNSPLQYVIGDIRDPQRLRESFKGVDIVVHAAALKHIPVCENNPFEAIQTNILGTKNVIDAVIGQGVRQLVAISSDKAVHPANIYGSTKLSAEKLCVHSNIYGGEHGPRFSCIRYGNFIGSRGSVISVFQRQRNTGRVTLTDLRMTRFYITLERATRFLIECMERMQGGEIFVPKMPSMKISDLARAVAPDCRIEEIGIRPGEKLHETLISQDEARQTTEWTDRYVIQPAGPTGHNKNSLSGTSLPEGFYYASDHNAEPLSVNGFLRLCRGILPGD